jgi:hypothetical protein
LLQAALKQLSQRHPYIMPYMDAGVYARLITLPLKKALAVVKALEDTGGVYILVCRVGNCDCNCLSVRWSAAA